MKQTGFKKKEGVYSSFTKKVDTPLKRSKLQSKPLKPKKTIKGTSKPKKAKLPALSTLRNKCDALLTPITKKHHPNCLLCGQETQVGHHHIKKSTSNSCRYYLPNLIGLCNKCHLRLHCDELLWCGRVIKIMGLDWLEDLENEKRKEVKTDRQWYTEHLARLQAILKE
jgi:5-methylcytosine-specific restriction endonuclease McrA